MDIIRWVQSKWPEDKTTKYPHIFFAYNSKDVLRQSMAIHMPVSSEKSTVTITTANNLSCVNCRVTYQERKQHVLNCNILRWDVKETWLRWGALSEFHIYCAFPYIQTTPPRISSSRWGSESDGYRIGWSHWPDHTPSQKLQRHKRNVVPHSTHNLSDSPWTN